MSNRDDLLKKTISDGFATSDEIAAARFSVIHDRFDGMDRKLDLLLKHLGIELDEEGRDGKGG